MRFLRIINIYLFVLLCVQSKAQFTDVDWARFESDTLLPVYTTVVELEDDYYAYDYTARIEYPEFKKMSATEVARFRLNELRDSLPAWPLIKSSVGVSAKRGLLDVSFCPIVYADGSFQRIESFKLVTKRTPLQRRVATRSEKERYADNSQLATGKWVKIRVSENGVYKITRAELSKMGFSNPDKVRLFGYGGRILPETNIHEQPDDLCEIPLWREDGYLLFYANGTIRWSFENGKFVHKQNVYSRYSYYFLNESGEQPMAFPKKEYSSVNTTQITTYPDYLLREKEEKSLCVYGRVLLESEDFSSSRTRSYTFDIPGVAAGSGVIDLSFGSNAVINSSVSVLVNNESVGKLSVSQTSSSDMGRIVSNSYPVRNAFKETTTVVLNHSATLNTVTGFLDYIRLNFTRNLALRGSCTNFRGSLQAGNATFLLADATADTRIWQVSDVTSYAEVTSEYKAGTLTAVAPATSNDEYVAVNVKGSFPSVTVVGNVPNQNLHSLSATDMVIIVPSNAAFLPVASRLAELHRSYDGISVAVVTAEQVYNEFSSGTPDATAYRRFMKMLYDRATIATDAPKYLLLFGDGLTDNRLLTYSHRSPDDYLLSYQSENSVDAVRSYVLEDYFGLLDDGEGANHTRDKVDLGVGRIPAQTVAEAEGVVAKLEAYMRNEVAGAWQNVVVLLGDDGDKASHMGDAEAVASIMEQNYPDYMLERIYWDDYPVEMLATGATYPLVTQAIYGRLNEGALIVNYSGHGSAHLLSHEMAWKSSDMASVSSPRIPFWVTASCDITPFDMGDASLGEVAMLNPNGAAIGLLTTTRTVLQTYNSVINRQFMHKIMQPGNVALGDAVRQAKNAVVAEGSDLSENKLQYVLIGDPALRLKAPSYKVVVEKFNDEAATATGKVQAGGHVTVGGYIVTPDGSLASEFEGVISSTLFDCAEEVTTRDNRGLDEPFTYTAYRKKLFTGSDSVRNGRFELTIPVPMDISYSDDYGMLNLFASDTTLDVSAQGRYDNFIVGGTAPSYVNDGKGPEITMYLNTPDFEDGSEVNSTPYLFAELYDENGINTIGTGIGHDILVMVDNDENQIYNLNGSFAAEPGDYRRGTVAVRLNELTAGEHVLLLRAWDIYNNSSVDTLTFVVVPSLAPDFVEVSVSPNPIRYGESARFVLVHDRPQSEMKVTLELFDFQGQCLWSVTERCVPESNVYTYTWDVTAQSGQPMPTGVYIYRARISSEGSEEQTKSRKIIILNNK